MSALRGLALFLFLTSLTQKIATPASVSEDLLLGPHHAGKLTIGMPESAIYKAWPRRLTRRIRTYPEGIETPTVQIILEKDRKTPSLVVILNGQTIFGIEVHDPRFKTAQGIGVGSSMGDLRKTKLHFTFNREEGDGLLCEELGMKFAVDIDPVTDRRLVGHEADPLAIIPLSAKIEWIWI
jgi:hypothetical protein